MPPKRKRETTKPERFRSKNELIPGLLNDIVIELIVGNLPETSIYQWTKFRAISKTFKKFVEHAFPEKPMYIALRMLHDNWWKCWPDEMYNRTSSTRLCLNLKDCCDYFTEHKGRTFEKKLPLRYVFITPNLKDLTVSSYVRADTVEKFKMCVQQKLKDSAPKVMDISISDLQKWLGGAINIKTLDRKKEEKKRKERVEELRLLMLSIQKMEDLKNS
jgi:hypothetical protein